MPKAIRDRAMYWTGCAFITAGLGVGCVLITWSLLAFILYMMGVVQVWYGANRDRIKLLWTVIPPMLWLIRALVWFYGMH